MELFEKPALFSNGRFFRDDLPEGVYCYDLRGSDDDPGSPICVEERVVVNHAGSVILTAPLEFPEEGRLYFTDETGLNFNGGMLTLSQFLQEQKRTVAQKKSKQKAFPMQSASILASRPGKTVSGISSPGARTRS